MWDVGQISLRDCFQSPAGLCFKLRIGKDRNRRQRGSGRRRNADHRQQANWSRVLLRQAVGELKRVKRVALKIDWAQYSRKNRSHLFESSSARFDCYIDSVTGSRSSNFFSARQLLFSTSTLI